LLLYHPGFLIQFYKKVFSYDLTRSLGKPSSVIQSL
jgi:hypothetical protein